MPRSDRSDEDDQESVRIFRLPYDAPRISEADYFRKTDEFRVWLKTEKKRYFDELSGDKARSYFRKFVKAWNKGKLTKSLYAGVDPSSVSAESQTSYKWSFKKSRADDDALRAVREEVGAATYRKDNNSSANPNASTSRSSRVQGPTLPSASDLAYARELTRDVEQEERSLKRKRDKAEARDRIEDMVGPKEVGREGMLEKKRAKRESDRSFRERGDEGLEAPESTLLGGGDSFKDQIAKRDAAKNRYEAAREEKAATARERFNAMRERNDKTMAMFQAMAKERYG
ncbi:hypothetical protein MIND_00522700 [Mycena indigotica]|uniref:Uncharacterized protein n=1 Tax=Mycena indigotica TaxID=2126181 RepID=A0A8H6SZR0_9AGAR|nr:uncharacterized protein MIND_00522700 [Mycena indigotica]KAF7307287.1 hypothetical protein MIND_00522700 [Mycena indigotica]